MNLVWGALYVLFWGLSLALGGLPWSAAGAKAGALANPHIWALLLSCLALEVLAPSHDANEEPGGFSSSAALLIAAAQRGWASAASLLCLVCLVLGGHPKEFKHRLLRLCPVQGALLLQAALHHLNAGPATYLAAGLWFLWSLAQSRPQGDKWTHQLYSHFGVAALAVFLGSTQDLWQQSQYLATLPLLLLAQQGPTSTTPERKGATQPLAPPSSEEMSLIQEQHDLMESFGQTLANLPGLTERAEFIVSTVQKLIPSRTVCLFLRSDSGQLEPRAFATEGSVADIAQGWHDIIADVWETGKDYCGPVYTSRRKQVTSEAATSPALLFTSSRGETFAAVFSVGPGVLFAGRELAHSPREADLLRFVVEKAKLALRLSWEGEIHSRVAYALESRLATLEKLLEGSRQLSRLLPRDVLIRQAGQIARDGLAHDYGAIWTLEGQPPTASVALEWRSTLAESELPLPSPQDQESVLQALLSGAPPHSIGAYSSLLLAPILTPSRQGSKDGTPEMWGILLLAAQPPGCYGPEHSALLDLLAAQLGVALENARLFHDVSLTRERLEQSQAELVQASKLSAIGQLAAGVAHELNSPLGAIALSLDTLQIFAPDLNEDAQAQVDNADQALRNAQRIVEHLLTYSRKTIEEQRTAVDLCEVCRSALDLSGAQLDKKGVNVQLSVPPEPVVVPAIAVELQQVVVNLLLNAAQAYDGQRGKIILEVFQNPLGRGLRVTDWAGGVPEALVSKIFDPFFTTKPVGKGTGLGLSISQELVHKFGGRIELQNRPGVGASFMVLFNI